MWSPFNDATNARMDDGCAPCGSVRASATAGSAANAPTPTRTRRHRRFCRQQAHRSYRANCPKTTCLDGRGCPPRSGDLGQVGLHDTGRRPSSTTARRSAPRGRGRARQHAACLLGTPDQACDVGVHVAHRAHRRRTNDVSLTAGPDPLRLRLRPAPAPAPAPQAAPVSQARRAAKIAGRSASTRPPARRPTVVKRPIAMKIHASASASRSGSTPPAFWERRITSAT